MSTYFLLEAVLSALHALNNLIFIILWWRCYYCPPHFRSEDTEAQKVSSFTEVTPKYLFYCMYHWCLTQTISLPQLLYLYNANSNRISFVALFWGLNDLMNKKKTLKYSKFSVNVASIKSSPSFILSSWCSLNSLSDTPPSPYSLPPNHIPF